jgi:ribulose-5-phosphate 4-epimerase/fuculose-1-phosphate aldolase
LAAALRSAARLGLHEGVCNHFSVAVPDTDDRFLINPQGLHWSEVKASDIVMIDPDGNVLEGDHTVEATAYYIHARIHVNKPTAACVLHTHMPFATSITSIENGRLEYGCTQNGLRFLGRTAYDDDYNGLALDHSEGDRMCARLAEAEVLFLANHGVIVVGPSVAEAFDLLYYLERACRLQVLARMMGGRLRPVNPDVVGKAYRMMRDDAPKYAGAHFSALKRTLDREEPEYSR